MSNLAEATAARAKTLQGRIEADGFEKKSQLIIDIFSIIILKVSSSIIN